MQITLSDRQIFWIRIGLIVLGPVIGVLNGFVDKWTFDLHILVKGIWQGLEAALPTAAALVLPGTGHVQSSDPPKP